MPSTTGRWVRLVVAGGAALIAVALVAASAPDSRYASASTTVETLDVSRTFKPEVSRSAERTDMPTEPIIDYAHEVEAHGVSDYLQAMKAERDRAVAEERHIAAERAAAAAKAKAAASAGAGGSVGVWSALRGCENGGSYRSAPGDFYRGAYQFDRGTWASLGYSGDPADADPAVQDEAARRLQARDGWSQWPRCSRLLGLR